jgi:hypothetical protein
MAQTCFNTTVTLTPLFKEMLNAVNAILESLAVQADIVSGVPRQMLGVIEQRDAGKCKGGN